jgi:hypothetical protein
MTLKLNCNPKLKFEVSRLEINVQQYSSSFQPLMTNAQPEPKTQHPPKKTAQRRLILKVLLIMRTRPRK